MSPRRAVLVVLGLSLLAVPVAAHGNYVSIDAQVSDDGTVRVEFAVILDDGFVVLHADADGEPGEPVGHREMAPVLNPDFAVEIDDDYWADRSGAMDLWAVLHHDDGDGRFEPDEDPALSTGADDQLVADRFAVGKDPAGPTNVIAERDAAQETDRNRVAIRRVRLAADGYVVVRADDDGTPGRIVGHRQLPAGEHEAVAVTLEEYFYETRPEQFALWAVVHTSDGDDEFDPAADAPVTAGDERVMSRFAVERTDPVERTPSPTPTATVEPQSETGTPTEHGDHEHTEATDGHEPTQTTASHDDHEHTHAEDTAGGSDDHRSPAPTPDSATTTPGQPGFGSVMAVLGVLLAGLLVRRRRAG